MKKIFAIAVLAFSVMSGLSAQNTLTIHQKDGQQFSYGFGEKPVVTFTDNDLIVTTANENVKLTLALTSVEKFTFDSNETAVNDIKDNAQKASISLDEYSVYIANVKENAVVSLSSADGKQLQAFKADADGTVSFSIADLPNGTYIISSENLSVKIQKKSVRSGY